LADARSSLMLVELLSERGGRFSTLSAQIADERSRE